MPKTEVTLDTKYLRFNIALKDTIITEIIISKSALNLITPGNFKSSVKQLNTKGKNKMTRAIHLVAVLFFICTLRKLDKFKKLSPPYLAI